MLCNILYWVYAAVYYHTLNGDTVSYILTAKAYIAGDYAQAVNGYWSPLISWLLVPLMLISNDAAFAFYSINYLCMVCSIVLLYHIIKHYIQGTWYVMVLVCVCTGLCILYATYLTADVLFTTIMLWYVYTMHRVKPNKLAYVWYGIMGALLYLSKSYGFYFFLVHFLVYTLYLNRKVIGSVVLPLGTNTIVFLLITLCWAYTVKVCTKQPLSLSTAAAYNLSIVDDAGKVTHIQDGLLPPTLPYKYTAWQNVAYHVTDAIATKRPILFSVKRILNNTATTLQAFNNYPRYGVYVCILLIVIMLITKVKYTVPTMLWSVLLLSIAGYLFYFIDMRYILTAYLLLIILIGYTLSKLYIPNITIQLLCYITFVYITIRPIVDIVIQRSKQPEQIAYHISKYISTNNIANTHNYATYSPYEQQGLVYYNSGIDYGGIAKYAHDTTLLFSILHKYDIQLLILPDTASAIPALMQYYKPLPIPNIRGNTVMVSR